MTVQVGWRWCSRCQALVFGAEPEACLGGKPHEVAGSGHYQVPFDDASAGMQHGWRWCIRCEALVWGPGDQGACVPGEVHDLTISGIYSVPHGVTLPGMQDGWYWCSRCQRLVFGTGEPGACIPDARHDVAASGVYGVPLERDPVHRLKLVVEEERRTIELLGEGYTPNSRVHIAFLWGPDEWTDDVVADAEGNVFHEHRDTAPGNCLVMMRDEAKRDVAAASAKRLRPRRGNEPVDTDPGTVLNPADG